MSAQNDERFLSAPQAAERLGISRATFHRLVNDGRIPKGRELSPKVTRWRLSDLLAAWEASPEKEPGAPAGIARARARAAA